MKITLINLFNTKELKVVEKEIGGFTDLKEVVQSTSEFVRHIEHTDINNSIGVDLEEMCFQHNIKFLDIQQQFFEVVMKYVSEDSQILFGTNAVSKVVDNPNLSLTTVIVVNDGECDVSSLVTRLRS